jgi:hypothetical protein
MYTIGNINDRSLLGERDSEMAIMVQDQDLVSTVYVEIIANRSHWQKFCMCS